MFSYFNYIFLVNEKQTDRNYPKDVRSDQFVQKFMACADSVVDPVLLVRLLIHRLISTPFYPKNSSSVTSVNGQEPSQQKTTRSRTSPTEMNASHLKKPVWLYYEIIYSLIIYERPTVPKNRFLTK